MKRAKIILIAALAMLLAGCALNGKPKAPPTPPAPQPAPAPPPALSIPQTQVELWRTQPLDDRAFNTITPPPEPAPPPANKPALTPPSPRTTQRAPAPKQPEPTAPETVARPQMQEILPADQQKQFEDRARGHRIEALTLIRQAGQGRRLTSNERSVVTNINQILKQSEQAEKNGDMRASDTLADRALTLAKELQSGK